MCLAYCHRLGHTLFYDHYDCSSLDCRFAKPRSLSRMTCTTCQHRVAGATGNRCGLTGCPLPSSGRCCHHNVTVAQGEVWVDTMLGYEEQPSLASALQWLGVPFRQAEGQEGVWVRLEDLVHAVPDTYGLGVEQRPPEDLLEGAAELPDNVLKDLAEDLGLDTLFAD